MSFEGSKFFRITFQLTQLVRYYRIIKSTSNYIIILIYDYFFMGNIIISLVIIFSIIIQKLESNVTNKKIIDRIQGFHNSVKKHFQKGSISLTV